VTPSFDEVITPRRHEDGGWRVRFDASWNQGRGAFGGVVGGALIRAMATQVPAELPLRTFNLQLCAPASGDLDLHAWVVRAGRNVAHVSAELRSAEGAVAFAAGTFGRERAARAASLAAPAPAATAYADAPILPLAPPAAPAFTQHIELRHALGGLPFSSASAQSLGGWTRLLRPAPLGPALALALMDAWPPACFAAEAAPRPVGTVAMSCHFLAPLAPAEAWLVSAEGLQNGGGYASQDNLLYAPDGRLIARSHQLVAVIR